MKKIAELMDLSFKNSHEYFEKWKEYFNLDIEKCQLANRQIDHVIEITYKVCKD